MAGAAESVGAVETIGASSQPAQQGSGDTSRNFDQSLAAASTANPDPEGLLAPNAGSAPPPANDNPDPEGLLPLNTGATPPPVANPDPEGILPLNTGTAPAAAAPAPAVAQPPSGGQTHVVQSGDTLGDIAARNGLTLDQLVALNPQLQGRDLNMIGVGETFNVSASPPPGIDIIDPEGILPLPTVAPSPVPANSDPEGILPLHVAPTASGISVAQPGSPITAEVKAGDSLTAIAERNGLSLDELVAQNPQLTGTDLDLIHPGETLTVGRVPATNPDPEGLVPHPSAGPLENPDPEGLVPHPSAWPIENPDPEGLLPPVRIPDPKRIDIEVTGQTELTQKQKDQLREQAIQLVGSMRGYGTLGAGAMDPSSKARDVPVALQGLGSWIYSETALENALKNIQAGDWGEVLAKDLPAINKAWTMLMNSLQTNGWDSAGTKADSFAHANELQALGNIAYILAVNDGSWGEVSHDSLTAAVDAAKKLSPSASYDSIVNKVLGSDKLAGTNLASKSLTPEMSTKIQNWMLGLTATLDVADKIAKMHAIQEGQTPEQISKTSYANALTANEYSVSQYISDIKDGAPDFARFISDNPDVGAQIALELGIDTATSYMLNKLIVGAAAKAGGSVTVGAIFQSIIDRFSSTVPFYIYDPDMVNDLTGLDETQVA